MLEPGFHFAQPWWLLGWLAIPVVWLWLRYTRPRARPGLESRYADPDLLPHLLGDDAAPATARGRLRATWVVAWLALVAAMAGPRWDYRQVHLFTPGADLVVLLDISRSMNVRDVQPSRLARARQELEDLLRTGETIRIGLVAFASVAHVIAPITDDHDSVLQQLPAISTDLTRLQGSRLTGALAQAKRLFAGQPETVAHNILLISDGGFAEADLAEQVTALHAAGIRVHILAVGSEIGGYVPGKRQPYLIGPDGAAVVSRVDSGALRALAAAGGGEFRIADYGNADTASILAAVTTFATVVKEQNAYATIWRERFHWLLIPAALLLLFMGLPAAPAANMERDGNA